VTRRRELEIAPRHRQRAAFVIRAGGKSTTAHHLFTTPVGAFFPLFSSFASFHCFHPSHVSPNSRRIIKTGTASAIRRRLRSLGSVCQPTLQKR
jgi:hypothetical protein